MRHDDAPELISQPAIILAGREGHGEEPIFFRFSSDLCYSIGMGVSVDRPVASQAVAIDLESEPAFRVGGAAIDPVSRNAEYAGGHERLQPQTLKVLVALTRRKPQVVTRSDLVDCCWEGRIVGDDVINRSIQMLRQFAERAGGFTIETVPKTGYRLVETAPPGSRRPFWLVTALIGAIVALIIGFGIWRSMDQPDATTIAVIPADDSRIARELSRSLLTRLGNLQAAKTNSMRLLGPADPSGSKAELVFEVS